MGKILEYLGVFLIIVAVIAVVYVIFVGLVVAVGITIYNKSRRKHYICLKTTKNKPL